MKEFAVYEDHMTLKYIHSSKCNSFYLFFSVITPIVKRGPEVPSSAVAAHRTEFIQQPCTPLTQAAGYQNPHV